MFLLACCSFKAWSLRNLQRMVFPRVAEHTLKNNYKNTIRVEVKLTVSRQNLWDSQGQSEKVELKSRESRRAEESFGSERLLVEVIEFVSVNHRQLKFYQPWQFPFSQKEVWKRGEEIEVEDRGRLRKAIKARPFPSALAPKKIFFSYKSKGILFLLFLQTYS